jgi:hypothetical protein
MTGVAIPRGANGRRPEASLRRKPTINDVGPNRRRLGWDGLTSSQQGTGCQCRNPSARLQVIQDVGYRRNRAATALVISRPTSVGTLMAPRGSAPSGHRWPSKTSPERRAEQLSSVPKTLR